MMPDPDRKFTGSEQMHWQDRMLFGQTFTDWSEIDHSEHGRVLVGGGTKFSSRVTPPFMLEEGCHRNFAFTMFHAQNMPELAFKWTDIQDIGNGLWQVTVEIENDAIIPTRLGIASAKGIGLPDLLTLEGADVVLSGTLDDRFDRTIDPVEHRPHRILVEQGIAGEDHSTFRFVVRGQSGQSITLRYQAEKARDIQIDLKLE
jgi:hypothetical protein